MKKIMLTMVLVVITSAVTFDCLVNPALAQPRRAELKPGKLYKVNTPEFEVDYHGRQRKNDPNGEEIVWISHARGDSSNNDWRQVVGAVKP